MYISSEGKELLLKAGRKSSTFVKLKGDIIRFLASKGPLEKGKT